MKVLIVSDTHRRNEDYFTLLKMHKPDLVIHCGDAEGSEYVLSAAADCPVQMVLGNSDLFSYLPKELELQVEGLRVWVTHGHNYCVSMGNEMLKREAIARGVDVVMYGHTHKPVVDRKDSVIAVNPGSLSFPRQDGRKPSYIIMEVEGKTADFEIKYLENA